MATSTSSESLGAGAMVSTPRRASQAQSEAVAVDEAVGRTAAEFVIPYPPGIPLIVPGERIEAPVLAEALRLLSGGASIVGTADAHVSTIRVLTSRNHAEIEGEGVPPVNSKHTATPVEGRTRIFEERESNVRSYCRAFPAVFTTARGATLFDEEGNTWVDFLAGAGALNYGHNPPEIRASLIEHLESESISHALDLHTGAKRRFLETFERVVLAPRNMPHKVQFTGPTGANAVEAALKIARKATGRTQVFTFMGGYHGMSLGALSVTSNDESRAGAGVGMDDVTFLPFPGGPTANIDSIAWIRMLCEDTHSGVSVPAAIIVEPVQAEGGVNVAPVEWLRELRDLCTEKGIVLISDEIQTGCGRTGPFFATERAGIVPDVITLSKSISGYGLPMSLVLLRPELDLWKPAEHNGTFRGNQMAFVAATAALEMFEHRQIPAVVQVASHVVEAFLAKEVEPLHSGIDVRGVGLIWGVDLAGVGCSVCYLVVLDVVFDVYVCNLSGFIVSDDRIECGD